MKRKIFIYTLTLCTLLLCACTNTQTPNNSTTQNNTTQTTDNAAPSTNTSQETQQPQTNTTQNNNDTNLISEEEAKAIALNHAGLTADQVNFIKSSLDRDDNTQHYDVEFYANDTEYDYEIDPRTGEILEYDHEAENYSSSSNTNTNATISEEKAKQLALDKVSGAATSDIKEFKLDNDNNKLHYEGTIIYEQHKYEFEIDANNGDILEWDVETIKG